MKSFIAIASLLLLACVAQFGFAFGEEEAAANDSINASQLNETLTNETLENATLINGTLENETLPQVDSDPFADAKNRKPGGR
jgi:hypothetical protein